MFYSFLYNYLMSIMPDIAIIILLYLLALVISLVWYALVKTEYNHAATYSSLFKNLTSDFFSLFGVYIIAIAIVNLLSTGVSSSGAYMGYRLLILAKLAVYIYVPFSKGKSLYLKYSHPSFKDKELHGIIIKTIMLACFLWGAWVFLQDGVSVVGYSISYFAPYFVRDINLLGLLNFLTLPLSAVPFITCYPAFKSALILPQNSTTTKDETMLNKKEQVTKETEYDSVKSLVSTLNKQHNNRQVSSKKIGVQIFDHTSIDVAKKPKEPEKKQSFKISSSDSVKHLSLRGIITLKLLYNNEIGVIYDSKQIFRIGIEKIRSDIALSLGTQKQVDFKIVGLNYDDNIITLLPMSDSSDLKG